MLVGYGGLDRITDGTYGYDAIIPLVPKEDSRLLTHMRKLSERAARRKAGNVHDGAGNEEGQHFDDLMDSDEDDSDGGRTLMTGVTGFTRMMATSGKSVLTVAKTKSVRSMAQSVTSAKNAAISRPRIDLRAETDGEVIDMLDPSLAKSVRFLDEHQDDEFSDDDDGVMEFDESGKLVIKDDFDDDDEKQIGHGNDDDDDDDENEEIRRGSKKQRVSKFESAKVTRDEAHVKRSQQASANKHKKEPKALGSAYKSKKAGGDVKRKDQKFEPYAYVPLDGKSYTKKNRSKAVAEMSTVVRQKAGKRKRK